MGMQGPLTAQALGRSPYDEAVDGEGQDDGHQPAQQYDHRGRPINPETKRMNRDLIRAHNEVMLVIGVAEPENLVSGPEAEPQRRNEAHETMAVGLEFLGRTCVNAVGMFGIHGIRQRILIYKKYSHIPFWGLFKQARTDLSISRDVLAGAPTSFFLYYMEMGMPWLYPSGQVARRILHHIWPYFRTHLEIYVVLQRMGIISSKFWQPSFFVPFTDASPIPAPPSPRDYTIPSLLSWLGSALISSAPFVVWAMTQRLLQNWRLHLWVQIFLKLPNTTFQGRTPFISDPPPPPPNDTQPSLDSSISNASSESVQPELAAPNGPSHEPNDEDVSPSQPGQETPRRENVLSTRGDEYLSDDEENEVVSATLISFDVEASESQDAPPGLWSAELRPSAGPDTRSNTYPQPVYKDTPLTRLPPLIATQLFTDAASRIIVAPYEATALRLIARMFRLRQGLPCDDIFPLNILSGVTGTWLINFLGTELLHFALSTEVWAAFAYIFQMYQIKEEEWKEEEGRAAP